MNDRLAWRVAICESELDATAKHVALALDTYMDRRGIAWPSKVALAARTGRHVRTVDRALARLERAEFVVVAHSSGKRSNLYCASLPNPGTSAGVMNTPTPALRTPTPAQRAVNPGTVPGEAVRTSHEALPADRSHEEDHINFNTDVDPAVLDLAYGWIASHRMPK